ncbi:DegV family protein [Nocardia terpenica]|uniref:Fatty acid-binding protein DegV n=1 Tax=Nocardia terpenica TaxID=455432 RepID=A0A164L327_9NOCA|nr:DegV family protein [Nocardia terpenica]KZM71970.1 fatty acid-binding protein DegV [Nocardia terpenica]MBF6065813.1 DegV family protein [Nocardia terpenica]MBF6108424.1 DegV family protein [Nocardia terpenica]MBF6115928.1 DegV family protein [Nocardia terpenica]MBF6123058.1 DegV family protein [Nocardia terpenica]
MAVVVVTDSAASLPGELVESFGIVVVPLHVLVDDRAICEGVDDAEIDYGSSTVTTSAPSPGELRAAYERALARSDGDGVVAVHISRQLSATWEAARQAIRDMDAADRIRLVDSLSAGLGTGLPVLAAARRARDGAPLEIVYDAAASASARGRAFIVVNRTEQLRRGGRLSTAAAFFGTELVTKPILQIVEGRLELREKARTRSKAYAKLVAAAVDAAGDDGATLAVQHLGAPEAAATLTSQLTELIPGIREMITAEFGPTLGVHLGSGAVGVLVVPGGCS